MMRWRLFWGALSRWVYWGTNSRMQEFFLQDRTFLQHRYESACCSSLASGSLLDQTDWPPQISTLNFYRDKAAEPAFFVDGCQRHDRDATFNFDCTLHRFDVVKFHCSANHDIVCPQDSIDCFPGRLIESEGDKPLVVQRADRNAATLCQVMVRRANEHQFILPVTLNCHPFTASWKRYQPEIGIAVSDSLVNLRGTKIFYGHFNCRVGISE